MARAAVLQLEQTIIKLPSSDQEFLYRRLERLLQPSASAQVVVEFREKRFANGFSCPHCGGKSGPSPREVQEEMALRRVKCNKTSNDATASRWQGPTTARTLG